MNDLVKLLYEIRKKSILFWRKKNPCSFIKLHVRQMINKEIRFVQITIEYLNFSDESITSIGSLKEREIVKDLMKQIWW